MKDCPEELSQMLRCHPGRSSSCTSSRCPQIVLELVFIEVERDMRLKISWSNPRRAALGLRLSLINFARVASFPGATTILPSARDEELSPLDSRHHCPPRRRLRDCATAPCIAHSRENLIKLTQSPALNAANLSNLLRNKSASGWSAEQHSRQQHEQFPSTCGGPFWDHFGTILGPFCLLSE